MAMAKKKAPKRPEGFREYLRELGRKGGKARLKKMTEAQRIEIARLAGQKSAEKRKKAKGEDAA